LVSSKIDFISIGNKTQHNSKNKFCYVSQFRRLNGECHYYHCDKELNGSKHIGTQHYDTQHNGLNCDTQQNIFVIIMLTVIMLTVIMLTLIMLTVIMLTVIMLTVIMLTVIMVTVIMLTVIVLSVVIMLTVIMLSVMAHTQLRTLLNKRIGCIVFVLLSVFSHV
jgi:hypothetical protein